jgi:hypothetical protein
MLSLAAAAMLALSAQAVEIEKNNKHLELGVRVVEAFEHGPIILDVTLTNRGDKDLEVNTTRQYDSALQLPDAWRCEGRYPCGGAASSRQRTLQSGETWTERHRLHITYLSHFPAGTYSITGTWQLWTPRRHSEDESRLFAASTRTFTIAITPATAENRRSLAKRLEAEFAALPKPSPRDNDFDTPLSALCEKVIDTPHPELVPLALKLLERCPVGERYQDYTYGLRRDLVATLFETDPKAATQSLIDRLMTTPPRIEPASVFWVWRSDNWGLPGTVAELVANSLGPYYWLSHPFRAQRDVLKPLLQGIALYPPRILPDVELRRLAAAKDFWVRTLVYVTFTDHLTPEWRNAYLKEVRARFGPQLTARQVAQLIRKLGDEEFAVREKADAELRLHRWEAGPALATAARDNDSPEVRKRAQAILDRMKPHPPDGPAARVLRTLSPRRPAERKLLETLAAGVKDNPVCKESREMLAGPKR